MSKKDEAALLLDTTNPNSNYPIIFLTKNSRKTPLFYLILKPLNHQEENEPPQPWQRYSGGLFKQPENPVSSIEKVLYHLKKIDYDYYERLSGELVVSGGESGLLKHLEQTLPLCNPQPQTPV